MEQPDPKHYNDFLQNSIQVLDTLVLSIELPPAIVGAINRQTQQFYEIQEFKYRVEREAQESRRKQIEANGIAAFQRTVSQGISDSYLRWRGIEATLALAQSPNSKIVIIGSGKDGLPIILGNVDSAKQPQAPGAKPADNETAPANKTSEGAGPDTANVEATAPPPPPGSAPAPAAKPPTATVAATGAAARPRSVAAQGAAALARRGIGLDQIGDRLRRQRAETVARIERQWPAHPGSRFHPQHIRPAAPVFGRRGRASGALHHSRSSPLAATPSGLKLAHRDIAETGDADPATAHRRPEARRSRSPT